MKISSVKQQLKRSDRYSIYVDGKYAFSLGESELIKAGLKLGQEISEPELEKLHGTAVLDKAYDRALNLIARRMRSVYEMRQYLKSKDYEPETIEIILERLLDRGLLNDRDFAKRWVANRRLLRSSSKRRLQQELRQKGIAKDIIDQVLAEDETDERKVLRELVDRKKARYPDPQKFMQYLMRKGFSYNDVKNVLNNPED